MTFSNAAPWLILAATLLSALVLWFVVSRWKGRSGLVSFVLVAGFGSAWLSVRYPQYAWIIFLAALLLAIFFWLLLHKLGKNLQPSTITWSQYLKGQGLLLFFFLLLGSGSAWFSVRYGPYPGKISKGQLRTFDKLDPSQHPVYEDVDIENYTQVSVFTRIEAPANGSATLTIYLDHGDNGKLEVSNLESEAATWSRWDQTVAGKHMSLVAGPPTRSGSVSATQMDILVFLSPR